MSPTLLQYIGAFIAMMIGFNGLLRPASMGQLVGLKYINEVGRTEIRVLFGSFLLALPIYALFSQNAYFFEFLGVAALVAMVIKMVAAIVYKGLFRDIWSGILVDLVLAVCLLSSAFVGI